MNAPSEQPSPRGRNDLLQSGYDGAFVKDGFGALRSVPAGESERLHGLKGLEGLTLAVKDVFSVQGLRTGAGNPAWWDTQRESTTTARAVDRLLRAGATWVGKTVTDELAFSLAGNNIHYGTPRNVLAPTRIPGGSSSGSAVAVAGGHADIGLATDCGGSARLPGSYCGVWGIRPSHGLVGGVSGFPLAPSFDTVGWFSRTGEVMQQVLDVVAPQAPAPTDLGWFASGDALDACDSPVQEAYRKLVLAMQKHTAVAWCPPGTLPLRDWAVANRQLQGGEIWAQHGEWVRVCGETLAPAIRERFHSISKIGTDQLLAAELTRADARRTLAALFERHGVLVVPTAPSVAPLLDATEAEFATTRESCHLLLAPAGLAGLPQVTLPWITLEGAPVGISVIGARGQDRSVVAAARKLEAMLRGHAPARLSPPSQASVQHVADEAPRKYHTDYRKRVAETGDYCITEYKVSPGQESPWHSHTRTADIFYVLHGRLDILLAGPTEAVALNAGESLHIPAGRVHKFKAGDPGGAGYLLIQGVGKPDFIVAER